MSTNAHSEMWLLPPPFWWTGALYISVKIKSGFFDTIYFRLFAKFNLIFIHYLHEVVNMNYDNFYWILISGYILVTFWKGQLE